MAREMNRKRSRHLPSGDAQARGQFEAYVVVGFGLVQALNNFVHVNIIGAVIPGAGDVIAFPDGVDRKQNVGKFGRRGHKLFMDNDGLYLF